MRSKIIAPFRRVMRTETQPTAHQVHFHADAHGRAFVCDHSRCESPRVSAHDLGLSA